jgi:ATP-binding cassette subfamily F protein 3
MIQAVGTRKAIHLAMDTDLRAGDQVLTVRELTKAYDSNVLWNEIGFHVRRGERIGIMGPNGSGKTTLLEVLLGRRDADGGIVKWGASLNIGYYDQKLDDFDPENTVLEEVGEGREDRKDQELRGVLAQLLFRGEDVFKPMALLSGGERARVRLAQLLLDRPNVLLLDEPTNHLDIASREALEESLSGFDGTILCVSHDRYFLDKVAKRLLILQPPQIADCAGNYTAWMKKLQAEAEQKRALAEAAAQASEKPKPAPAAASRASADRTRANPYLRPFGRLTREELEQQITETEIALAECQNLFGDADSFKDPARSQQLQADYEQLSRKLEQLEEEYFTREE